ncbi:S1 family peptidase [Sorangium sp. So ce1182]|uniref:S1 family peptidase n=1 Tax=Sorangium sp. So ce1182 TaxID=3133334 RepID=UPI003F64773D
MDPARTAWGLAAILTLGGGCGAPAGDEPAIGEARSGILGGRPAMAEERLATVAVVDTDDVEECSGVLIAPRVVVTAAHCVVLQESSTGEITAALGPKNLAVVAGALDVAEASADQKFPLREVVRHPAFAGAAGTMPASGLADVNDIALLLLERPVEALEPAAIPPLWRVDEILSDRGMVVIAGYGEQGSTGADAGALYIAETPYRERNGTELIAGGSGEPDGCAGDSGGPAYVIAGDQRWLLGVSARALPSQEGGCGSGGVYTLLPAYTPWLEQGSHHEYVSLDGTPEREQSASCAVAGSPGRPAEHAGGGALVAAVTLGARRARSRRPR